MVSRVINFSLVGFFFNGGKEDGRNVFDKISLVLW
jgi:hypothetical protein